MGMALRQRVAQAELKEMARESGLVARHVGRVRWVLFASPDYVARRGRPRTPRDLNDIGLLQRNGAFALVDVATLCASLRGSWPRK
jgi:DNA-binding transcriptional LysR family regulator